jgi:hypothetical protein
MVITRAQVSIITCKMLGESGRGYYTNVIKCIDYCIANGARITSMSLGFTSKGMGTLEAIRLDDCARCSPLFDD